MPSDHRRADVGLDVVHADDRRSVAKERASAAATPTRRARAARFARNRQKSDVRRDRRPRRRAPCDDRQDRLHVLAGGDFGDDALPRAVARGLARDDDDDSTRRPSSTTAAAVSSQELSIPRVGVGVSGDAGGSSARAFDSAGSGTSEPSSATRSRDGLGGAPRPQPRRAGQAAPPVHRHHDVGHEAPPRAARRRREAARTRLERPSRGVASNAVVSFMPPGRSRRR
jgi:hypothetical protein